MEHLTFPKYTENDTAFLGKFQTLVPPSEFEKRKKKKSRFLLYFHLPLLFGLHKIHIDGSWNMIGFYKFKKESCQRRATVQTLYIVADTSTLL